MRQLLETASVCPAAAPTPVTSSPGAYDPVSYTERNPVTLNAEADNGKYLCFWSTDLAGNTAVRRTNAIAGIDAGAFGLTITTDRATLNIGDTATLTFTAIEPISGFAADDIDVSDANVASVSNFTPVSPTEYTATLTADAAGSATVSVAASKYTLSDGTQNASASNNLAITVQPASETPVVTTPSDVPAGTDTLTVSGTTSEPDNTMITVVVGTGQHAVTASALATGGTWSITLNVAQLAGSQPIMVTAAAPGESPSAPATSMVNIATNAVPGDHISPIRFANFKDTEPSPDRSDQIKVTVAPMKNTQPCAPNSFSSYEGEFTLAVGGSKDSQLGRNCNWIVTFNSVNPDCVAYANFYNGNAPIRTNVLDTLDVPHGTTVALKDTNYQLTTRKGQTQSFRLVGEPDGLKLVFNQWRHTNVPVASAAPPTVTAPDTSVLNGSTVDVTLTASEAVTGFEADDLTVSPSSIAEVVSLTAGANNTYTLRLQGNAVGLALIGLNADAFTANSVANEANSRVLALTVGNSGSGWAVGATPAFTAPAANAVVNGSAVTVSGTTINNGWVDVNFGSLPAETAVADGSGVWSTTFDTTSLGVTAPESAVVTARLRAGFQRVVSSAARLEVTVDNHAPTVAVAPDQSVTTGGTATVQLRVSEALNDIMNDANNFAADDITLSDTGVATVTNLGQRRQRRHPLHADTDRRRCRHHYSIGGCRPLHRCGRQPEPGQQRGAEADRRRHGNRQPDDHLLSFGGRRKEYQRHRRT